MDKETDDIGAYNVEYLIMKNNTVSDLQGAALRLYRGGKDESTFGPFLEVEHNVFNNVGFGKKNKYQAAMSLYGVQVNDIENNNFNHTNGLEMHLVVGEPIVNVLNNNYYESGEIRVTGDEKYTVENLYNLPSNFMEGSFELSDDSKLKKQGTDGKDIGIIAKN